MKNGIDSVNEVSPISYYDTSLRDIPGPRRTFEGQANTGNILPLNHDGIRLNLDQTPVGIENLYSSIRHRKSLLYASGGALYSAAIFEGALSLLQSGVQISEVLHTGQTTVGVERYLLGQAVTISGMIMGGYLADSVLKKARRARSH